MNSNKCILFPLFLVFTTFIACRSTKNLQYFSDNDQRTDISFKDYELPIKIGDQLAIHISALNPQLAVPYNVPGNKPLIVDLEGNIDLPLIGKLQASGTTRNKLKNDIILRLQSLITDPSVAVDFENFKVSVLGEVNKQGSFVISDGRVNILEAIALAGDLTRYAEKMKIVIIREKNEKREFGSVDLTSMSIFSSPYYKLEQNDIIYVAAVPEKPTVKQENSNRQFGVFASIFGIITTVTLIVITAIDR